MGIQLKLPSYMTHTYKFTTVSLLEYLLFLPYPVHLGRSPNTPTCQPPPVCRLPSQVACDWAGCPGQPSRAGQKGRACFGPPATLPQSGGCKFFAQAVEKRWKKFIGGYQWDTLENQWCATLNKKKTHSFSWKKAGSSRNTPCYVFGDTYSHTQGGSDALSFLLSCYVGGVGWGGAVKFMFTCTHRIGYIMISSLALAHRHICCYVMISSLGRNPPMDIRHNLAKWQLPDNMNQGWKTCRLNFSSSNDPNTCLCPAA